MPNLSIRRLDDETYRSLRQSAARHGRSMEEEARQILRRAVLPVENLGDLFSTLFGPKNGIDLQLPAREVHQPLDFSSPDYGVAEKDAE